MLLQPSRPSAVPGATPPRRPARRRLALALTSTLGLATALAVASLPLVDARAQQAGGKISQDQLEKSRKLMEEGQALYAQQRYADAIAAFQKAYAIQPFPAFLFNEGVCHEKLGDTDKAIEVFKRYVAADPGAPDAEMVRARIKRLEAERDAKKGNTAPPAPPPAETKAEVMRSLVLVESDPPGAPAQLWLKSDPSAGAFKGEGDHKGWKQLAKGPTPLVVTAPGGVFHVVIEKWRTFNGSESDIEVYPGRVHQLKLNLSQGDFMGYLRITSEVEDAEIFVDDPPPHQRKPWGTTPHGELLPPGKHKIWVEAPGYETYEESVSVEAGQRRELAAPLERVGYGYLLVDGNAANIKVLIDGEPVGVVESEEGPLRVKAPKGKHRLRAEAEGKKAYDREVDVPAGQSREVHVLFMEKPSRALGWGAAIGSAALLGTGIYFGLRSNALHDGLRRDREAGTLASDDGRPGRGKLFAYLGDGGLALGGLLAGLAVYGFVRDPFPPTDAREGKPQDLEKNRDDERKKRSSLFAPQGLVVAPQVGSSQGGLWLSGAF